MITLRSVYRQPFYSMATLLISIFVFLGVKTSQHDAQASSTALAPSDDAYVASGQPNQIAVRTKFMLVGYDQTLSPHLQDMQILMRFQLPTDLQDKVIESAMLSLYLSPEYTSRGASSLPVSVQLVTDQWSETDQPPLTWQRRLGFNILSTPITTTVVATTPGVYTWDLRELVKAWVDQKRGNVLGVILSGDAKGVENKRSFYTKDCSNAECGQPGSGVDKRPKLDLVFAAPTVTPTNTPTSTPTPTATPLPPPGIAFLRIRGEPTGVIAPGEKLTYTIAYRAADYPKDQPALDSIVITNDVPAQAELIPGTIRGLNGTQVYSSASGTSSGSVITWFLQKPVQSGEPGSVAYTVRRVPLPDVPANGLSLVKQGPTAVAAGQFIEYKLIVENLTAALASSVVITDRLPVGAEYIGSSDGGSLKNNVVKWQLPQPIAAGQSALVRLIVRANQTITNDDYRVEADEGLFAQGSVPVTTIINGTSSLPPASNTLVNQGAWITWLYNGKAPAQPLTTGPTYNPLTTLYFPLVAK